MKRNALMRHLFDHGAELIREGRRHTIVGRGLFRTEVPRHNEIVHKLARRICRDLEIPFRW